MRVMKWTFSLKKEEVRGVDRTAHNLGLLGVGFRASKRPSICRQRVGNFAQKPRVR
jgi:hypothetical protein